MSRANGRNGSARTAERLATRRKSSRFVPIDEAPPRPLSPRAREVVALFLCGFCLYGLLCLWTFAYEAPDGRIPTDGLANLGGAFGYHLAAGFVFVFGYAGAMPFLVLLGYGVALFLAACPERAVGKPVVKALGSLVFAAMLALLLADLGQDGVTARTPWGAGGAFGSKLSPKLLDAFGNSGRMLLVAFGTLLSLLLITEWLVSHLLRRALRALAACWRWLRRVPATTAPAANLTPADARAVRFAGGADDDDGAPSREKQRKKVEKSPTVAAEPGSELLVLPRDAAPFATVIPSSPPAKPQAKAAPESDAQEQNDEAKTTPPAPAEKAVVVPVPAPAAAPKPKPIVRSKPKPRKQPAQTDLPFDGAYPFPPLELFREMQQSDYGSTAEDLQRGGDAIVLKLASFDIQAEVVAASVGPAVTQYELRLAEGIRVGKLVGFEADLAAALRAVNVRVVAPIPGKDTVGIEVPNPERQKVWLRDLLDQFGRAEDLAIPLFLGKDVAGNPIVEDLARMPHLLIAGTTGSGKSVCINTILISILMTRTPAQVKLILVDPKMVELQAFKHVPHLCCDVVTNMKKAPAVLQWAVDEMENRYALLSAAGVNHIRSYNRLGQQELEKRLQRELEPDRIQLPYIVIVVDEFADLMNVAQNEVEDSIQRLAQKSRSVGMHVIVATQRPSTEVITGIIKANLPCQIAFRTSRKIDSRVILDANGAEKLLGHGDMLYVPPGGSAMLRAQGTFVADEEIQAVVRFLLDQGQRPDFLPELSQTQSSSRPTNAEKDELYRQAVEVVLGQQRGSATLLQRALAVGYTRATRLLEMMEEDGFVGPFVGSKSREVMLTLDEWKAQQDAIAEEFARSESGASDAADAPRATGEDGDGDGDARGDDGREASA